MRLRDSRAGEPRRLLNFLRVIEPSREGELWVLVRPAAVFWNPSRDTAIECRWNMALWVVKIGLLAAVGLGATLPPDLHVRASFL